ncbi:hypothetical protein QE152_g21722 [Popillia japonica]|uniref:Uncharacterized protein n=1 Tax=Popillia japonica TaxID=7064 RepID=A0AAW1KPK0_POPJA
MAEQAEIAVLRWREALRGARQNGRSVRLCEYFYDFRFISCNGGEKSDFFSIGGCLYARRYGLTPSRCAANKFATILQEGLGNGLMDNIQKTAEDFQF